ncbi:hypothetical protein, partial [Metallibacterium sp.]|uniref:hypothetical protein n=1 Tax=Metallibacterium sp. TaxID=2940281 RepID=UPI00262AB592
QDHRFAALTLPHSHLHGPDHHPSILPMMHRPAHDTLEIAVTALARGAAVEEIPCAIPAGLVRCASPGVPASSTIRTSRL